MKKVLLRVLSIALLLFIAKPCWAIIITHLEGTIYAETGTNYLGDYSSWNVSGWEASGGVEVDEAIFDGTSAYGYGQASGYKINGPQNENNHARFILHSTAQSAAGSSGIAYETYALVRSGMNPDDMIKFVLTPESGEEGKNVELTAEAVLAGTLNSSGLTGYVPYLKSGTAQLDFTFEIYKDPTESPIISFIFEHDKNPLTSDGIDDKTGVLTLEESFSIGGSLGTLVDTTFKTGEELYVFFEQIARATVPGDDQSSAKAYAVQSTNDVITIAIEAHAIPEPSIILLLGSLIIGLGFLERKKYRRNNCYIFNSLRIFFASSDSGKSC